MTIQHSYSYLATLHDSQKVNWRVEDLIGGTRTLDFSKAFLPESLARTGELELLSAAERLTLNHIRGATYLHLFGLVEEFIRPFIVDRAQDSGHPDKNRLRALLTFAEEEAKHQQLFERFAEEFRRGFHTRLDLIGPAADIAAEVLKRSPLAIAILTLHLEWLTQRHYLESVKTDERLDPQFVSLLKHHWQEEAQHAKLDTLLTVELARDKRPAEILQAIDDFLGVGVLLDGGLQQQVKYDVDALEAATGRHFSADERARIESTQLRSYRWTFLVSGLEQESFARTIRELSEEGLQHVKSAAAALSRL